MSKKENYVFPNIDALKTNSQHVMSTLNTRDDDPLKKIGVVISPTLVVSHDAQTVGEEYMEVIETYNKMQPEMGNLGIIGPDFRFKPSSSPQLSFTAGLTAESLDIGQEVCSILKTFQPSLSSNGDGDDGTFFPTLSPFFCTPTEKGVHQWFHIPAPDQAPYVGIVALTEMYAHVIPHSEEAISRWDALTTNGDSNPLKKPIPYVLSRVLCDQLETFPKCDFHLNVGQVLIVHRGTPIKFSGLKCSDGEEEPFVAKTVVLEILKKNNRRKSQYTQALNNGGFFPQNSFGEVFPLSLLEKQTTDKPDKALFSTVASPEDVPFYVGVIKPKPKAPAPTPPPPPDPVKEEVEEEVVEEESSSSSSSSTSPSEIPAPTVDTKPSTTKNETLAVVFKTHDTLREQISKLDPRVWEVRFEENANSKREKFETTPPSALELKQYKSALETLSKKVDGAMENAQKLAPHLEKLARIKTLLDGWETLPVEFKDEIRRREANKKKYQEYTSPGVNIISKGKKIQGLLDKVLGLEVAVEERFSKANGSVAGGGGGGSGTKRPLADILDGIEPVDEDALEPDERTEKNGDNGWHPVVSKASNNGDKYIVMGQALGNPIVFDYIKRFQECYEEITSKLQETKGKPDFIDVSKIIAYTDLLETILNRPSEPVGAPTGAKRSANGRVKCSNCEQQRANFDGSDHCHACWVECIFGATMKRYEDREDLLQQQVKEERKTLPKGQEGPLSKALEEYKTFSEEFHGVGELLEKPNPKAATLNAFKALRDRADKLLPSIEFDDEDGDGEEYNEEEDEASEGLKSMFVDDDEDEVHLSGDESSSRVSSKKRERSPSPRRDASVAESAMDVLSRYPLESEHEKIYDMWKDKSKRERLMHHLDDLKENAKHLWCVKIKFLGNGTENVHAHYTDEKAAKYDALELRVPDVIETSVVKQEIKWE